ncbi:MAG: DUF2974 domain-containing protein [Lachnospiraceae bacterium]|nr:DUF2974 domain-containing protein [Lachnospiraceae bacterium]
MALTTEQLLILNNLMYMGNSGSLSPVTAHEDQTVGEWLGSIDQSQIVGSDLTTQQEWQDIINAALADPTISNMTIATTNVDRADGGGGGVSALFVSEATGDAVVTFCGTASEEWKDDFLGGNMTDTPQQQNALDWYQSIYESEGLDQYELTVTGHSKGGNKAKYITILDGRVDHCVSFDGQGFSDQFMNEYADEIAARQGLIENHNLDHDYVNFLLNDIGTTTFYTGYGVDSFEQNHCANSFMHMNPDGTWYMEVNPNGRADTIEALDNFVNGYLRSLPEEDRGRAMELFGTLIESAIGTGNITPEQIIELCLYEGNDDVAYMLGYFLKYGEEYGFDYLHTILDGFGLGSVVDILEGFTDVLESSYTIPVLGITITFEDLWEFLQTGGGILAGIIGFIGLDDIIAGLLSDHLPFDVSGQDLQQLLQLLGATIDYSYEIELPEDTADIVVSARTGHGFLWMNDWLNFHIIVDAAAIHAAEDQLSAAADHMATLIDDVDAVINSLGNYMPVSFFLRTSLMFTKVMMADEQAKLMKMHDTLEFVLKNFQVSEEKIIAYMGELVGN